MHRLLIIEDQTAVREILAEVLATDPDYTLVGQCGDGHEALRMCLHLKPDLVILDAKLPGMGGVDLLRHISRELPATRVLVFSGNENPHLIREMLEAGAHGFIAKTANFSEFKKGLAAIALGGTYYGAAASKALQGKATGPSSGVTKENLTKREREILQLVSESHTTKAIASRLGISAKTVDNHRTNLMRKLDIHDIASLTRHVIEAGSLARGNAPS